MTLGEGSIINVATTVAVYFGILAVASPIVWAIAEGVAALRGKMRAKAKDPPNVSELRYAAIAGPGVALLFFLLGWLPVLPTIIENETATLVVNGVFAAASGFGSTFGAKQINDRLAKPRKWKLGK